MQALFVQQLACWEMRLSSACMDMDSYCQRRIAACDQNAQLVPIPLARQAFVDVSRVDYKHSFGSVASTGPLG